MIQHPTLRERAEMILSTLRDGTSYGYHNPAEYIENQIATAVAQNDAVKNGDGDRPSHN